MSGYREHVQFDVLNDLIDGRLPRERREAIEYHIASCHQCRREHDALHEMLAAAATVPHEVLPDRDMWPGIRSELLKRKSATLPQTSEVGGGPTVVAADRATMLRKRLWLAAAAVVLIVLSSGITATVLRNTQSGDITPIAKSNGAPENMGAPIVAIPASFRTAESEYLRTFGELRSALEAQRHQLRPETVATVERSLAVVDSAIAEARTALLADPNNAALLDLLSSSYERKLDLLRRASELGSRT